MATTGLSKIFSIIPLIGPLLSKGAGKLLGGAWDLAKKGGAGLLKGAGKLGSWGLGKAGSLFSSLSGKDGILGKVGKVGGKVTGFIGEKGGKIGKKISGLIGGKKSGYDIPDDLPDNVQLVYVVNNGGFSGGK